MKKVVIRAPNWLGDIVMSMPFFSALPEAFPDAEFHVIVKPEYEKWFSVLPFKIHTHVFNKTIFPGVRGWRKFLLANPSLKRAEYFFVLPPSFSAALMSVFSGARVRIGFTNEGRGIFLNNGMKFPRGLHRADEFLLLLNSVSERRVERRLFRPKLDPYFENQQEYIVVNVNSEASSRRMPIEQWKQLLPQISTVPLVFVGTQKERSWVSEVAGTIQKSAEVINLAGKTDILELARVMAHSKAVVTNDSGPAHLAAFVGANVITWIGAADAVNTVMLADDPKRVKVFTIPMDCSPCLKNKCPLNTIDCLKRIPMNEVLKSVQRHI